MILINLLPHREEKRKERRKRFIAFAIGSVLLGAIIALAVHLVISGLIDHQESRNQFLTQEIKKLDAEIAEIQRLQEQIDSLLARKQVIESLQSNRAEAVYVFEDLLKQLPEGVYFETVKQSGLRLDLVGIAQSNARVSTLMRQLESSSHLKDPKLMEVKATVVEGRPASRFTLQIMIDRPAPKAEDAAGNKKGRKK